MNYRLAIDNIRDDRLDLVEEMCELRQKFLATVQNLSSSSHPRTAANPGRLLQSEAKYLHHDC